MMDFPQAIISIILMAPAIKLWIKSIREAEG